MCGAVVREEERKNTVSKSDWGRCSAGGDIESKQFQGQRGNITLSRYKAAVSFGKENRGERTEIKDVERYVKMT